MTDKILLDLTWITPQMWDATLDEIVHEVGPKYFYEGEDYGYERCVVSDDDPDDIRTVRCIIGECLYRLAPEAYDAIVKHANTTIFGDFGLGGYYNKVKVELHPDVDWVYLDNVQALQDGRFVASSHPDVFDRIPPQTWAEAVTRARTDRDERGQ